MAMAITEPHQPKPPIQASPGRRLFHLTIAIAGWAVFIYWWILVLLRRVSHKEIAFTAVFILATLAVCVAITVIWTIHNQWIFNRKRGRTHVPAVREDFSTDSLGHPIHFEGGLEAMRRDPVIQIRLERGSKNYRPSSTIRNQSPSNSRHHSPSTV